MKTTVPEGLAYAYNLGHVDVFPATSGKENAARYLMERFDASPASCFLLCDDDNDLGARFEHTPFPNPKSNITLKIMNINLRLRGQSAWSRH